MILDNSKEVARRISYENLGEVFYAEAYFAYSTMLSKDPNLYKLSNFIKTGPFDYTILCSRTALAFFSTLSYLYPEVYKEDSSKVLAKESLSLHKGELEGKKVLIFDNLMFTEKFANEVTSEIKDSSDITYRAFFLSNRLKEINQNPIHYFANGGVDTKKRFNKKFSSTIRALLLPYGEIVPSYEFSSENDLLRKLVTKDFDNINCESVLETPEVLPYFNWLPQTKEWIVTPTSSMGEDVIFNSLLQIYYSEKYKRMSITPHIFLKSLDKQILKSTLKIDDDELLKTYIHFLSYRIGREITENFLRENGVKDYYMNETPLNFGFKDNSTWNQWDKEYIPLNAGLCINETGNSLTLLESLLKECEGKNISIIELLNILKSYFIKINKNFFDSLVPNQNCINKDSYDISIDDICSTIHIYFPHLSYGDISLCIADCINNGLVDSSFKSNDSPYVRQKIAPSGLW